MTSRPRDPGQAGVTMVEMAVVVALLGLVLTMAMQGVVSYQRATAGPTPASRTSSRPGRSWPC